MTPQQRARQFPVHQVPHLHQRGWFASIGCVPPAKTGQAGRCVTCLLVFPYPGSGVLAGCKRGARAVTKQLPITFPNPMYRPQNAVPTRIADETPGVSHV